MKGIASTINSLHHHQLWCRWSQTKVGDINHHSPTHSLLALRKQSVGWYMWAVIHILLTFGTKVRYLSFTRYTRCVVHKFRLICPLCCPVGRATNGVGWPWRWHLLNQFPLCLRDSSDSTFTDKQTLWGHLICRQVGWWLVTVPLKKKRKKKRFGFGNVPQIRLTGDSKLPKFTIFLPNRLMEKVFRQRIQADCHYCHLDYLDFIFMEHN